MTQKQIEALKKLSNGACEYDDILAKVARNVREFRLAKKWTPKDLAESAGIDYNYVRMIESGSRNVSVRILTQIAGALNVPFQRLFK